MTAEQMAHAVGLSGEFVGSVCCLVTDAQSEDEALAIVERNPMPSPKKFIKSPDDCDGLIRFYEATCRWALRILETRGKVGHN